MSTTAMPPSTEPAPAPRGDLGHLDLARIAQDLQIRKVQVEAVVQLLDEGNTIPFITRYRKERTGGLDEEVLRIIQERVGQLRQMGERKQTILRTIEQQGKLTDDLRAAILAADNPKRLEDLYLPYKPKKKSLANAAREKGLEALAMAIWTSDSVVANLDEVLPTMLNPERGLASAEDILLGAQHILAEMIAENADIRACVRAVLWDTGKFCTTKSDKLPDGQGLEYRDYFNFNEPVRQIPPHRVLAINRGEDNKALSAKMEWDREIARRVVLERLPLPRKEEPRPEEPPPAPPDGAAPHAPHRGRPHQPPFVSRLPDLEQHPHRPFLERCAEDGLERLLGPSLEREIRRELTQRAQHHAVMVFARNLRSKLLAAPLLGKRVLAVDPAFRTGCKLAALDETGNPLDNAVIFPHAPQNKRAEAKAKIEDMVRRFQINVIAIGNGTACRETEELISEVLGELEARRNNPTPVSPAAEPAPSAAPTPAPEPAAVSEAPPAGEQPAATAEEPPATPAEPPPPPAPPAPAEPLPEALPELAYVIVNEAGASVYSASPVGKEEFPTYDATLRGTISIGRRLQDPLAELVKIDPQHVGVGLYQHDVKETELKGTLDAVIESCVNTVGVDLNTASVPLLRHVSGLNHLVATDLVEYRKQNGPFRRLEQIHEVKGIGPARFTQAAGFLKIPGGENPLDNTWVHPESYAVATQLLSEMGYTPESLSDREKVAELREKLHTLVPEETAARLQIGVPTLIDIFEALAKPGRDPREDMPPPIFKKGVLKLEDLQAGMELKGTVLNVVDFGAFIDIGLKDSGLVHISQMANRYVKSPYDVVAVGDVVSVWVLKVEPDRSRVSLTMIQPGTERRPPERRPPERRGGPREGAPPRGDGPPREGQPAREHRGEARPPREGPPREGAPRGDRPPREGAPRGDRPPREGAPRGDRPPREGGRHGGGGGGGQGGRRSTLPPRGTSRIGTNKPGVGKGGGKPQPGQEQSGEGQATPQQEATQTPPQQAKKQGKRSQQGARLSQDAISGKEPLSSFSQLAALMEARNKKPEEPQAKTEPPPQQEPPTPPEQQPVADESAQG